MDAGMAWMLAGNTSGRGGGGGGGHANEFIFTF